MDPDVGFRDHHVLGEGAVALHAHADGVDAHLAAARAAVAADAAHHVALAGYPVAHFDVADVRAHRHHFAVELVAGDQRGLDDALRPGVPGLDVEVGAADPGGHHPDFYVGRTGFRFGPVHQLETGLGA